MKNKYKLIALFFCVMTTLIGDELCNSSYEPWYTGPLLAVSGNNIDKGFVNIQPYIFELDSYGHYDSSWKNHSEKDTWSTNFMVFVQYGLLNWLDTTVTVQGFYNRQGHIHAWEYGDTSWNVGFQLLKDKKCTAIPSLRLVLRESFPTGHYQHLDEDKNGLDASGSGAYATSANFILDKVVYWIEDHPIDFRINIFYSKSTSVHVHGFNVYGGSSDTSGKVESADSFSAVFAFQFSLNQRWVFASDFVYIYGSKVGFKGEPGVNFLGETAFVGSASSAQISIAPALEYNFNANLGVIGGAWFSVGGRNIPAFVGGAISVTYTF